jgi:K+/H+ antiporter YhaU regulatory subunit KhtT
VEIVVILRGQDVLLPNPESVFKAGDRLLVITSPQGRKWLENHFVRLSAEEN